MASSASPSSSSPANLTASQLEQLAVEAKCADIYQVLNGVPPQTRSLMLELWRDKHMEFLTKGLTVLGPSYQVLDANRPWICYWLLHSIALLGESVDAELEDNIIDFLSRCQDKNGGYGGGPGQLPHLATTYAAVNALTTLGTGSALSSINRDNLHTFLLQMKDSSGAFRMHDAGEMDTRACYTAISVGSRMNFLDAELVKDVGNFIVSCQTFEGGIAGEPGSEAHGGYTFCGLATMILINEVDKLDLPHLIDWVAYRQGVECGFQGRINKLVDGCYSFWQGGALALLQRTMPNVHNQIISLSTKASRPTSECDIQKSDLIEGKILDDGFSFINKQIDCGPLFHSIALQQYILLCSQVLEGGFKDKPGKHKDHYHSCYCLSGLSICQYSWSKKADSSPLPNAVLGPYSNLLEPVHPLHNVVLDKYLTAHEFFWGS